MGIERREFERAHLHVPIRYRSLTEMIELWLPGIMLDISAAGLRLMVEEALEVGTRLVCEIVFPGRAESYTLFGEIVSELRARPKSYEYGLAFTDVTPDKQAEIDELVQFLMR